MYSQATFNKVPKMSTLASALRALTKKSRCFAALFVAGLVVTGFSVATKRAAPTGISEPGNANRGAVGASGEGSGMAGKLPQGYGGGLERIVALYMERDQIVSGTLDRLGPEIRKILNAAAREADRTGHPEFANSISEAHENLHLGHRHITKFVTDNDAAQFSSAARYLQMSLKEVEKLAARGAGQPWHDAIKPVPEKLAAYIRASERLRNLVSGQDAAETGGTTTAAKGTGAGAH